ncbi:MAG: hypothetical protein FJX78_00820 [Armatimonadetes bacterium]|nr:hypothetical protein [Armatimonadota bacterium]
MNRIDKREIDADVARRSARVVADDVRQAGIECGDLAFAAREGAFDWDDLGELAEVVAGRLPGRTAHEEITLFESQGISLEDIVAAKLVYDAAEKEIGSS